MGQPAAITKRALLFLDSWLAYRAAHAHDVVGFSVAIRSGKEVVFSKAYGLADVENATPLTTDHLFNMASQTKMMTSVLCLQLVERGELRLGDPIVKYLPWLRAHPDPRIKKVTIRHLLSHASGLPREGQPADFWMFTQTPPGKDRFMQAVLKAPLTFDPGTSIKYSNMGYALLGQVLEVHNDQPFTELLETSIIQPLGLDALADYNESQAAKIPTGYGLPYHHKRPAITGRSAIGVMAPVTGLYATSADMCNFAAALFNGDQRLLQEASKKHMRQAQSRMEAGYDQGTAFGLGHEIQMVGRQRIIGHSGHVGGHVSATFFDPKKQWAVSVASNAKDTSSARIARGIWGALEFFLQYASPSLEQPTGPGFSVRLCSAMSTVEVLQVGPKLIVLDPDDWEPFGWHEELAKVDDTTLRFITPGSIYNEGELLRYQFAADGTVIQANLAGFTLWPESSP